jgi:hypothetical protein
MIYNIIDISSVNSRLALEAVALTLSNAHGTKEISSYTSLQNLYRSARSIDIPGRAALNCLSCSHHRMVCCSTKVDSTVIHIIIS